MKRALLNIFTGICLLCCIAILVLRSASFYGQIFAAYDCADETRTVLWNERGNLIVWPYFQYASYNWPISEMRKPFKWRQWSINAYWYADPLQQDEWIELEMPYQSFAGFGIKRRTNTLKSSGTTNVSIGLASVPHWFLAALFAIFPMIRTWRPLRRAYGRHQWLRRSIACSVMGISCFSALCVVLLGTIWIRSYYVGEELSFLNGAHSKLFMIETGNGGLGYFSNTLMPLELFKGNTLSPRSEFYTRISRPRYPENMYPYAGSGPAIFPRSTRGFLFSDRFFKGWGVRQVTVPIWSLVCVAGIFTLPGVIQFRRRLTSSRLSQAGCCSACGYDLRATPERCPECGKVAQQMVKPPMGHG